MKLPVFSLALLVAGSVLAQPTFTAQDLFSTGATFNRFFVDPTTVSTVLTGANFTWDYFNVQSNGPISQTAAPLVNQPAYLSFPGSSFVFGNGTENDSTFSYYTIMPEALTLNGYKNIQTGLPFPPLAEGPMIYNPPVDEFRFPSTFNTTFNQNITGTQTGLSNVIYRYGAQTVTFDGYGKITTPLASYENVLRYTTTQQYTDSLGGFALLGSYTADIVTWISPATAGIPIFRKEVITVTIDGSTQPFASSAFYSNPQSVGINATETAHLNLFPNPAAEYITVAGTTAGGNVLVDILSLTGQLQRSLFNATIGSGQFQLQLPVDDLAAGIYLIRVTDQLGASVKKISVR